MNVVINKEEDHILYRIVGESGENYEVCGINYRIKKTIPKKNIETPSLRLIEEENKKDKDYESLFKYISKKYKGITGTVLHIDTDGEYIRKCVELYKSVGVYVFPVLSKENEMADDIQGLELNFTPDVIVLTGHDYFNGNNKKDINDYLNSSNFAKAVLISRKIYPNSIIIAGACQSLFEVLIARGANFASSPERKNIHIYDPAIIAIYSCITPQKELIDFFKMEKHIEDLKSAFGGIKTFGKMKIMY